MYSGLSPCDASLIQGPGEVFHIDGYDKLKPYGFSIHGCIDGFSRKILWLEVIPSNKNPLSILELYLNCVESLDYRCPKVIRSDRGTETVGVNLAQKVFRHHHIDSLAGDNSYRYGGSKSNTRIEAWWSQFRRSHSGWWIDVLSRITDLGYLDITNELIRDISIAIFLPLLRDAVSIFKDVWNRHRLRHNHYSVCPSGQPDIIWDHPELFNVEQHLVDIDKEMFEEFKKEFLENKRQDIPVWMTDERMDRVNTIVRQYKEERNIDSITVENCESVFVDVVNIIRSVTV
jgi:hypothetical protein